MNWNRLTAVLRKLMCVFALFSIACVQSTDTVQKEPSAEPGNEKDSETIVILHTNDVHCALNDNIGYDGLSLYKEEMMQKYDNVLLVDAGDAIQGDIYGMISNGEIIINLMNDVGYDCATLGNHEFDYGMDQLDDLSEKLNCGYICANFCTPDGEPVFDPYRIIETGGKKIAFIGVDTPSTFIKSWIGSAVDDTGMPMYDFMTDETGERLVNCVQKYVDEVHEKGADLVILLSHLGNGDGDELRYHSEEVIAKTTGIDILIDGHSHDELIKEMKNKNGETVYTGQTGTKLNAIGKITVSPDGTVTTENITEVPQPDGLEAELVTRGKTERWVSTEISKKIDSYIAAYDSVLNRKIGTCQADINVTGYQRGLGESGNMNLLTDALREAGDTELSLYNAAAERNGIAAGDVLYSDIIQAFPYANETVVIEMKGKDILDAIEYGARRLPSQSNAMIHGSGLQYTIDVSVPSSVQTDTTGTFLKVDGEYRVKDVLINGEPLDTEKMYTVTTNSYMQACGDGMTMFRNSTVVRYLNGIHIDILVNYIENSLGGVIPESYAKPEGRITVIGQ